MPRPKPKTQMHMLGLNIEKSLWVQLRNLAMPENTSVLIRKVLRNYVKNEDKKSSIK